MKNRAVIAVIVAAVAGLIALVFVQFGPMSRSGVSMGVGKAEAACTDEAPSCLPRVDLIDTQGKAWTADSLAGKVVIVNFWATWCKPCKAEIPDLSEVYDHYRGRDVILIGVLTDVVDDATLDSFAAETGINYPIVRLDDELASAFAYPSALPTTFVYDRSGHLAYRRPGAIESARLEYQLDQLL